MQGCELETIVSEKRKCPVKIEELIQIKAIEIDRISKMVLHRLESPMFHISVIQG
jgi:hypothetical protein